MLRVASCDVNADRALLRLDLDGELRMHILHRGLLEQYVGAYGLGPGAALNLLLVDPTTDEFDVPPVGADNYVEDARRYAKKAARMIEWEIDRDQALADITLADDTAEMVRASWEAIAADPRTTETHTREDARRLSEGHGAAIAAEYERRQEELLAEEFVSGMVSDRKSRGVLAGNSVPVDSVQSSETIFRVEW